MCKHAQRENGLQDLMEIMLENMMVAKRGEFYLLKSLTRLMASVPVMPMAMVVILGSAYLVAMAISILRNQEECDRLEGVPYIKGLTQLKEGEVFYEICGLPYTNPY